VAAVNRGVSDGDGGRPSLASGRDWCHVKAGIINDLCYAPAMRLPGAKSLVFAAVLSGTSYIVLSAWAASVPPGIQQGLVDIPGGTFMMGSAGPDANENEKPVHRVTVADYRLDRTEVTVKAYGECVRAGVCSEPDAFADQRGDFHIFCNWRHPQDRSSHPINCVDYEQANTFCYWAGKRLPSEEEWEYAARGGEERTYPWGNQSPDQTRLNACEPDCQRNLLAKRFYGTTPMYPVNDGWPETAPVGSFPAGASKHGVLDLAGNVWEWTATLYASYDGMKREPKRVLRGGSWGGGDVRTERTTNRFRLEPTSRAQFLGFRCAK
jgi:formylglycine-generating enzyme required for sulfatase activity